MRLVQRDRRRPGPSSPAARTAARPGRRRPGSAAPGCAPPAGSRSAASSGRSRGCRRASRVRRTLFSAAASRLDAAYGRSLTNWPEREAVAACRRPAAQSPRVDLEQQRRGAAARFRLREADVRRARGHVEGVHPVGVLHQQVAEIGGRLRGSSSRSAAPAWCQPGPRSPCTFSAPRRRPPSAGSRRVGRMTDQPSAYRADLGALARANEDFRRVLATTKPPSSS